MLEFAFLPDVQVFGFALVLLLVFAGLEAVSLIMGLGVSDAIGDLLPDFDLDADVDVDADLDMDLDAEAEFSPGAPSLFMQALSWLKVGDVPFLVFLALFLAIFGLSGLALQSAAAEATGAPLHWALAIIGALIFTAPGVRLSAGAVGRVFPKLETSAIPSSALIGREAVITLGTARAGSPAEAKLTDEHGTTHYVMVEPGEQDVELMQGSSVRLLRKTRKGFLARASG